MELKNFFAQDDEGNILGGAVCYLYQRGTESLVNELQASNGVALANPFVADQQGLIQFAAPNGIYDLRVVKGSRDYRLRVQCNDVTETSEIIDSAVRVLEEKLADPVKGATEVAAVRKTPNVAKRGTVDFFLATKKVSLWEYEKFITSKADPSDPTTWDWLPAYNAATAANSESEIILLGDSPTSGTIQVYNKTIFDCNDGAIVALPGFAMNAAVIRFGNSVTSQDYRGRGGHLRVKGGRQRVICAEFSRSQSCGYEKVSVEESLFVGIKSTSGSGLSLGTIKVHQPMILGGKPANADLDSVGLLVTSSDGNFGAGACVGSAIGSKFTGNNNTVGALHNWGVYERGGIPQSVPMLACFWNEGQSNTFVGCIADSPSLIDYNQPASLANGGYGFVNRGNGWQTKFIGCNTFIPNRVPFGDTMPVGRIVGNLLNQGAAYTNCEVTDDTGVALVPGFAGRYQGTNLDQCTIIGRQDTRIGNTRLELIKKAYMKRGLEFNATYQDADEHSDGFGNCSFDMQDLKYLKVVTNFGGTTRIIEIQRWTKGTNTLADYLKIVLVAADEGYTLYRTDLSPKRMTVWDGTKFTKIDGTSPV
ncbi:hypothetical protein QN377_05085 [Pseudomonas sp. CCC4.1]|uniref:hypothetical protein n=1 Tax=Pseudomonas sp. CCC4.1 TaxID=3048610 RepID=UPI002AB38F29|nr:hypothetical protein [Pseudomonas sp. CCC4.1]MDY7569415.1 hypothetical protein [Pseudomonas sp. CCC4.1]MEB0142499.1 hypothetical protein [Pseudomonas sp. CCC4.1]